MRSTAKLADWLRAAKHRSFVGRAAELELFREWLVPADPPFNLLYIFAPGGVGKTTLLHEYAHVAAEHEFSVHWVDGRMVPRPSPEAFLNTLYESGDRAFPATDFARSLLIVDTFELLAPLHRWFRDHFVPSLSRQARVVVAGRTPPDAEWRTDLAWRTISRIVSLRNLGPDESRALLAELGVPERHHAAALACTHGHPLALVLVADLFSRQLDAEPATLERAPDVVHALVERFTRDIPSDRHREALEICAHARVTTESVLADLLGPEEGRLAFDWLRGLSFVEHGPDGIFPHDLVRDVLDVDLRWRNPDAYRRLHHALREHVVRRIRSSTGVNLQRAGFELLYLHRNQPFMKPYFEWTTMGSAYAESASPRDRDAILEMVRRHEGPDSAQIAAYWLDRQPRGFVAFRDASDPRPVGFLATLTLSSVTPDDLRTDPAIRCAWEYIQRYGPLRSGECFLYHRFWMGRDQYQVPAVHNLVANVCLGTWLTTGNLAWTFPCGSEPDFWEPMFAYINFRRAREADFEMGGRRFGVFAHDWRVEPPHVWLQTMGERETDLEFRPDQDAPAEPTPLVVLARPEFVAAVRQALRDYSRPDALAANPLLRSRVVRDRSGATPSPGVLQKLLRDAATTLQTAPKDEKLYRAVYHTYFSPAPTQEAAAELLDLPFSTFRLHLSRGIERIAEWLWQREVYGLDDPSIDASFVAPT